VVYRKGERRMRDENSDGHPGGWPSIIHREADVTAYVPITTLAGLPARPVHRRTRFTRLRLIDV
jgi:hypothetical protein